jgi:hypothetical protein
MESGGAIARFPHAFRAALGGWLVGPAGKIPFLEADVAEHSLHEGYVLGLTTVRRARHGELLVAPPERVESAGAEKGENLKGLCAGPPVRECVSVPGCAEKLVALPDYRSVYSMFRFNAFTAGNCDIELVRLHHAE